MPINTALLIAAPMLQDLLVDTTGLPMAAGTITCYHDNNRTTLKNWYYQTGTPGNYTYIPLPNPLTLSAAGTITDINGVDTIPFFYPYLETDNETPDPYYITIVNAAQTNQITRANFPFLPPSQVNPGLMVDTFNNLIINNGFWRNIKPNTINVSPSFATLALAAPFLTLNTASPNYSGIVAPSQHDAFHYPDIQFIKTNLTATETVAFIPFSLGNTQPIMNNIVPEYYLQHNCTGAGSAEMIKCYQFPISLHVNTLANVPYTVSIQAQNAGTNGVIQLFILQDTGTGTTSPAPISIGSITLNTSWTTYTFTGVFPATTGLSLGNGADDGLYLQVQMPLNLTCTINFTKPSLYLTENVVPTNDFQTYDQVDAIINSPRTGDLRTSLNSWYPYGWVQMNDGSIGGPASVGSTRANSDTWPLFNLLWTTFKPFFSGTNNLIAQMFNSSGSPIAYGGSAIGDFNSGNSIALTKMMGKVLLGTVPVAAMLTGQSTTFTAAANVITAGNSVAFFNGMPVYFTGGAIPGALVANTIYYVTAFNGTTQFNLASTFANAMAGTTLTFGVGSGNVISQPQGSYEGEYAHTQLSAEVGSHTHNLTGQTGVNFTALSQAGGASFLTGVGGTSVTLANSPSGTPFNITQPGTFYNIFIKL